MQALRTAQATSPIRKRALVAMEEPRLNDLADQPTQITGAVRLPLTPHFTQPIPLSELLPPAPKTTGPILPLDDLGRAYYKVCDQDETDTIKLVEKAVTRYHTITGEYPFCVVFSSALRYLHACAAMPYYRVGDEKIPFVYEEDNDATDTDVMARG